MSVFEAFAAIKAFWGEFMHLLALWPWFVGFLLAGYLLGAWLGWKGAAVIAAILGLVAFLRSRPRDTSVGWEDGEPQKRPVPPRRGRAKRDWTSADPWKP